MASHSSVLAWRIPSTGEPGGLSSMDRVAQSRTRLKRLSSSSSSSSSRRKIGIKQNYLERSPGPGEKRDGGLQGAPMSRLHAAAFPGGPRGARAEHVPQRLPTRGRKGLKRFNQLFLRSVVRVAPRRAIWANGVASCDQSNLSKEIPLSQVEHCC